MGLKSKPFRPTTHFGPKITSIPSEDLCRRLAKAMPYVPTNSQNFARSLVQNHETYGGWTPKQLDHANLLLERARESYHEQKGTTRKVKERSEPELRVSEDGMRGLKRLFDAAGGKALILVQAGDMGLRLKPATKGGGYVLFERGTEGAVGFMGGLKPTGALDLRPKYKEHSQAICDAVDDLGLNPAKTAKRYASAMKHCCFCGQKLTDGRSKVKGYGPICAAKFNLPWGE